MQAARTDVLPTLARLARAAAPVLWL